MTTMDTPLEKVLKKDILQDVFREADAVKVYGNIYGLNNLGRSYFCTYEEVVKKASEAETQMMQKYGSEIYGKSAQLRTQHVAKSGTGKSNMASTGTGSPVKEAGDGPLSGSGGLIHCSVQKMKRLPSKFFEAAGDFSGLKTSIQEFNKWLDGQSDEWKNTNRKDIDELKAHFSNFRQATGPTGMDNTNAWVGINEILKKKPWSDWMRTDKEFQNKVDQLRKGWTSFTGNDADASTGTATTNGVSLSKEDKLWDPAVPVRIDIQTNFDENWYKRKFKSGLLNALIMGFKTAARARVSAGGEDEWTGHKYTADEMLPQDIRKLDGIQWKMTNKVTHDYIKYLLGWSREKKKVRSGTGFMPFYSDLSSDPGVGEQMAKKGLSGRGILGRLKQKIFSGGQSNNVVSVAFQMADPNDGWTLVDKNGDVIKDTDGEAEGGETGSETSTGSTSTASSGAETGSETGSEPLTGTDVGKIKSLLQRVMDLEKQVWGKVKGSGTPVSESTETSESSLERLTDRILFTYLEDSI